MCLPGGAFPDYDFTPVAYLITVHTGDRLGAGTDSTAYVELHGEYGNSGRQPLEKPGASADLFQRAGRDRFKISWPDLGSIREITLGHNNTGMEPGWFVDKVVVENLATRKQWTYRTHRWFDKEYDDGAISRRLKAENLNGDGEPAYKKTSALMQKASLFGSEEEEEEEEEEQQQQQEGNQQEDLDSSSEEDDFDVPEDRQPERSSSEDDYDVVEENQDRGALGRTAAVEAGMGMLAARRVNQMGPDSSSEEDDFDAP